LGARKATRRRDPAGRRHPPGPVLFRVAGSAHIGFGHVVRAVHLARALRVVPRVSVRGGAEGIAAARRIGAVVDAVTPARLATLRLRLLVIDDPSARAARPWLAAARRAGVPVASVHDRGLAPLRSDLAIDGSLAARAVRGLGRGPASRRLGPRFAILDPRLMSRAGGRSAMSSAAPPITVVIGLGGGRHALAGLAIASAVRERLTHGPYRLQRARVLLSFGLTAHGDRAAARVPPGVGAIAPARFRAALGRASIAIVAGGTTLYEACALGTPAIAVAVVPGQRATVDAFVRAGLAVRGVPRTASVPAGSGSRAAAIADAALALLADARRRRALASAGPRAIDGHGAARAARALEALAAAAMAGEG
jgi:spore coat polysaccharide biosynthesis predicted glycosyltransferase SpsG